MMVSQRDAEWSLIACCSHEDRCRAIFECMSDLNMSGRQLVFEIKDPPSTAEILGKCWLFLIINILKNIIKYPFRNVFLRKI